MMVVVFCSLLRTRAVFVEFTLYNANVNLFQSVTFLVEFPVTGASPYMFCGVRVYNFLLRWGGSITSIFDHQADQIHQHTGCFEDGL